MILRISSPLPLSLYNKRTTAVSHTVAVIRSLSHYNFDFTSIPCVETGQNTRIYNTAEGLERKTGPWSRVVYAEVNYICASRSIQFLLLRVVSVLCVTGRVS